MCPFAKEEKAMLRLTRERGEAVIIGDCVKITVVKVSEISAEFSVLDTSSGVKVLSTHKLFLQDEGDISKKEYHFEVANNSVKIMLAKISGKDARITFDALPDIEINREELFRKKYPKKIVPC